MKTNSLCIRNYRWLGVFLVLGFMIPVMATRLAGPMTKDRLVETPWFEITDEQLSYRLHLDPRGSGLFAYQFASDKAKLYEVVSWVLSHETNVVFQLKPLQSAEPLKIEGDIRSSHLILTVVGDGWQRKIKMQPESDFEARLKRIKAAMGDPRK